MNFKQIIEKNDTPQGRIFDLFIQFLILVSLVSFSVETLPNLSGQTIRILKYIEVITVSIFTLEYLSRIVVADRKFKFVFSFYGIIDFLAILPFYLPTGIDLRAIRILRLLRLFRAFKLLRYSLAIKRFHRALLIAKEELVLFTIVAVMVLYFASVGIYFFENSAQPEAFSSVFQSLWWALCTLTTVGYGDVYPVTAGGKIFTFFVLMVGLGVVAVPTGLVASALSSAREYEEENK
ncbi:MAG: ion transporter [Proteobacteria bacterium]|nr:ion transporter [Pseudomonadota bacterium]